MRIPSCGVSFKDVIPVRQYPCGCAYLVTGERISFCEAHQEVNENYIRGDEWMTETRQPITEQEARSLVACNDVNQVNARDKTYGSSWKKRGGVGAFMMMARKWDRIENIMNKNTSVPGYGYAGAYDVFQHMELNAGDVVDDLRDLRRYLLLIEAEMLVRGKVLLDGGEDASVQETNRA